MRGDRPFVAEGIFQPSVTIAPELVHDRHFNFRARLHRAIESGINPVKIDVKCARRPADRLWRESAKLREFVAQHDDGVPDLQFRMHDLAVGTFHGASIRGAKGLFIEFDGTGCIADREGGCDAVVSIGNGLYGHRETSRVKFGGTDFNTKNRKGLLKECDRPRTRSGHETKHVSGVLEEPVGLSFRAKRGPEDFRCQWSLGHSQKPKSLASPDCITTLK